MRWSDLFTAYKPIRERVKKAKVRIKRIKYKDKVYEYKEYYLALMFRIPSDWVVRYGDVFKIEVYGIDHRRRDPRPRIIIYPVSPEVSPEGGEGEGSDQTMSI